MKRFIFVAFIILTIGIFGCTPKKNTITKKEENKVVEIDSENDSSNRKWKKTEEGYRREKVIGKDVLSLQAYVVDSNKDMMETIKIVDKFLTNYDGSIFAIKRSPTGDLLYKDCNTVIYYQANRVVIENGATIGKWETYEEIEKRWNEEGWNEEELDEESPD